MAQAQEPLIKISGLKKSFGRKPVLKHVDMQIQPAESTALIGPSSSGKTVLMKCLLGLVKPDAGQIIVEGVDVHDMNRQERDLLADRVGVLFQQNALFDSMTNWENVAFRLLRKPEFTREEARERAIQTMAMFGLEPRVGDLYPADISGGMQKRVAFARAIATQPDIVLLDSPTAGLDPIMTKVTNDLIRRGIERYGSTVFIITGDVEAAQRDYDRLAMLYDGEIIWQGPSSEAKEVDDPRLQQLLEGSPEGPIAMQVRD